MMNHKVIELDSIFFQNDVLELKEHPNSAIREKVKKRKNSKYDFSNLQEPVKSELKNFLQHVLSKEITEVSLARIYLSPLFQLIDFFGQHSEINSLKYFSTELVNEFQTYLQGKGIAVNHPTNGKSVPLSILERAYKFYLEIYDDSDDIFSKDIWRLGNLEIDNSRKIESMNRETISFYQIANEKNKSYVKEYLKYLIINTDKALSTIYRTYRDIQLFLEFISEKDVTVLDRDDVIRFIEFLNKKGLKNTSFNYYIFENKKFIEYLIIKGHLSINHFYPSDIKSIDKEHVYKSVDDSVIKQIFSVLDKIPFQESCMFLLLYSTGMRVSEVCAIKRGSLYTNENGYFIRFYSQKMRKEVDNPISKSLYELLITHQKRVGEKHGKKTNYLFPNESLGCYRSGAYRKKLQEYFRELEIKNPDGTLYQFKPHDYRHTLATTMILNDVPISVVQNILHHDTAEMTVDYIDLIDQKKINRHKEFINIKGESMPIHFDTSMSLDDIAKVEWLKKSINAQMLPNGMCSLPVVMGKCPHANSCLTCGEFRTSKEFLPVHEKHYKSVCSLLDYAKQQGWQRQVETNEEVKANLEVIIEKLKNDNEENAS